MALEEENAFYDAHRAELREKYLDKWLVITGGTLWGVYDKFAEAAKAALGNLKPGGFMIHKPADDGKVINMPNVRFKYPDGVERPKAEIVSTVYASGGGLMKVPYAY